MTETASSDMRQDLPGGGTLGVMDATRMGWRLMMVDFWPIWVVGLVAFIIQIVGGCVGSLPYIGACIQLAVALFVQPQLGAGLFYAVRRRIDGAPAQVGDVFEGFRQRYWQSLVAMLLPMGVGLVGGLLIAGIVLGAVFIASEGGGGDEEMIITMVVAGVIALPILVALGLVSLLFIFSLLTVWDHPESGWEAVKDSMRVVKAHYLSTLGFALLFGLFGTGAYLPGIILSGLCFGLLFGLIGMGASLAGIIACCVGGFFTMLLVMIWVPLVMIWFSATAIYLYRAWTGQPLVQPLAVEAPPEGSGPVPPTSIEPPPPPPGL